MTRYLISYANGILEDDGDRSGKAAGRLLAFHDKQIAAPEGARWPTVHDDVFGLFFVCPWIHDVAVFRSA
jgi:hypothetical protein